MQTTKGPTLIYNQMFYLSDGFFDAGMLLQALKTSQKGEELPNEKAENASRSVGKELKLNDY